MNEKLQIQQLSNERDKVSQELESVGLNKEKLVVAAHTEGER